MKSAAVKFLGNTDDVTTCECCGKQNLKSTVALSINDADPVYYGVTCAARALALDAKYIKAEARKADRAREDAEQAAKRAAFRAESERWFQWLSANGKGADVFTQIQSLGGYAAAHTMYEAR